LYAENTTRFGGYGRWKLRARKRRASEQRDLDLRMELTEMGYYRQSSGYPPSHTRRVTQRYFKFRFTWNCISRWGIYFSYCCRDHFKKIVRLRLRRPPHNISVGGRIHFGQFHQEHGWGPRNFSLLLIQSRTHFFFRVFCTSKINRSAESATHKTN